MRNACNLHNVKIETYSKFGYIFQENLTTPPQKISEEQGRYRTMDRRRLSIFSAINTCPCHLTTQQC